MNAALYLVTCLDTSHLSPGETTPGVNFFIVTKKQINDALSTLGCPLECGNKDPDRFQTLKVPETDYKSFIEEKSDTEHIFLERGNRYVKVPGEQFLNFLGSRRTSGTQAAKADAGLTLDRITQVEEHLTKNLIGQPEAISSVMPHLRTEAAELKRETKPVYVAIVAGPTGVGKTSFAYLLSEGLHGNRSRVLRIPCEGLKEGHTASSLLGSPPGYAGSRDKARGDPGEARYDKEFIEVPYTVILFDEIEKAHQTIHDHLLGVMNDGEVIMRSGEKIDFSKTIIILTSNAGSQDLSDAIHKQPLGYRPPVADQSQTEFTFTGRERKDITMKALAKIFRPEFLGRLDDIIVCRWLDPNEVKQILDLRIAEFNHKLLAHRKGPFSVRLTDEARTFLASEGFNTREGARRINKVVDGVRTRTADLILSGELHSQSIIIFDYKDEVLKYDIVPIPIVGEKPALTDGKDPSGP